MATWVPSGAMGASSGAEAYSAAPALKSDATTRDRKTEAVSKKNRTLACYFVYFAWKIIGRVLALPLAKLLVHVANCLGLIGMRTCRK